MFVDMGDASRAGLVLDWLIEVSNKCDLRKRWHTARETHPDDGATTQADIQVTVGQVFQFGRKRF